MSKKIKPTNVISQTQTATTTSAAAILPDGNTIYGNVIPVLFGKTKVSCTPLWAHTAGGIFNFAVAIGIRSPLSTFLKITRIWSGGVLIFDIANHAAVKPGISFVAYPGDDTQPIDPTIAQTVGATKTPAFRDLAYIVFKNFPASAWSGTFPQIDVEVIQGDSKIDRLLPYTATATASYNAIYVNWQSGLFYAFKSTSFDVFDINQAKLVRSVAFDPLISGANTDLVFAISGTAGNFYTTGDVSNRVPVRYISGQSGAVLGSFGLLNSGTSDVLSELTFPTVLQAYAAPAGMGFDEMLLVGTEFGGVAALARTGNALAMNALYPTIYNFNTIATACRCDIAIKYPGTVPLNYSVAFVAGKRTVLGSAQYQVDMIISGPVDANPLRNNLILRYMGYYQAVAGSSAVTLALPADVAARQAKGTSTPFFSVLGKPGRYTLNIVPTLATEEIFFMSCGPADNPYLVVLTYDATNSKSYYYRYDTIFSFMEKSPPEDSLGYFFSSWALMYAAMNVSFIKLEHRSEIPLITHTFRTEKLSTLRTGTTIFGYPLSSDILVMLDLANGSYSEVDISSDTKEDYNTSATTYTFGLSQYQPFDALTGSVIYWSGLGTTANYPGRAYLAGATDDASTIGSIMSSMAVASGYDAAVIENDIEDDDPAIGAIINKQAAVLDVLSEIAALYRVDISEAGGKIKFIRKTVGPGLDIARDLVQDDLAPVNANSADDAHLLEFNRDLSIGLPTILNVSYIDPDNNYTLGAQSAKRKKFPFRTAQGDLVLTIGVPIVMHALNALSLATVAIFSIWDSVTTFTARLPPRHMDLEPGDYITISIAGFEYKAKLDTVTLGADYSVTIKAELAPDAQAISPTASQSDHTVPPDTGTSTGDTLVVLQPVAALLIDNLTIDPAACLVIGAGWLPPVSGQPAAPYAAVIPLPWASGLASTLYRIKSGVAPAAVGSNMGVPIGATVNALADTPAPFQTDLVSRLIVSGPDGWAPQPTDADGLLSGACMALVGDVGRWELIFFQNVTDNGDGTFTLDTFLRGRRGSDVNVGNHRAGDFFISDATMLTAYSVDQADFNLTDNFLNVIDTKKITDSDNVETSQSMTALSLKPWAVANIKGAAGTDVVLTWKRRYRGDSVLHDSDGLTPIGESQFLGGTVTVDDVTYADWADYEAYDLEITNSSGVVLRTESALPSATFTYTAAMQAADSWPGAATPIYVNVYQLSTFAKRGFQSRKAVYVE